MKKRIVIRGTVEVPLAKGCVAFIRKKEKNPSEHPPLSTLL